MVMDREAWYAALHGGLKEVDITEQAHTPSYVSLSFKLLALKV